MADTSKLGAWGESLAGRFLQKKGYTILAANYRCRYGEIDLIARNRKYLVFVEVKLRRSDRFAQGREFVDMRKQERLRATASMYLAAHDETLPARFDVIEIYAPEGIQTAEPVIHHLEDAFQ